MTLALTATGSLTEKFVWLLTPPAHVVAMLGLALVMIFVSQQQISKPNANARPQRNSAMSRTSVLMDSPKASTASAWQQLAHAHVAEIHSDVLTQMMQTKTSASQNPLVLVS